MAGVPRAPLLSPKYLARSIIYLSRIFIEEKIMRTIQITFEDDNHARAKAAAHAAKMTLGDFVRAAVAAHVSRIEDSQRTNETGDCK